MLASLKEECCLAFTKDRRKCRLKKDGEKVCKIHKHYFASWLESHPPLQNESLQNDKGRIFKEYMSVLSNKHVIPTESYVRAIPRTLQYIKYYMFMCSFSDINPLWNRECFKNTIYLIVNNIFSSYLNEQGYRLSGMDLIQEIYSTFSILFKNHETVREGLKYVIFYSINNMISLHRTYETSDAGIVDFSMSVYRILFGWVYWRSMFLSQDIKKVCDEVKEKLSETLNPNIVEFFMNTVVMVCIENGKEEWRTKIRSTCNIYKEELIMNVWSPIRIKKILDSGLDVDDF